MKDIEKILELHKKWLNDKNEGEQADLSEADLRGANLREANLREAYLRGAYLSEADLSEADLRGADLRGAYLREAYLREAYLSEANLRGADLRGADLRGADLREADLSRANLRGTKGIQIIENEYPYQCYAYYYDNEKRIRFGCHDRTLEEWEKDFWNNDKEFPENSKIGQLRYINFKMFKMWFDFN